MKAKYKLILVLILVLAGVFLFQGFSSSGIAPEQAQKQTTVPEIPKQELSILLISSSRGKANSIERDYIKGAELAIKEINAAGIFKDKHLSLGLLRTDTEGWEADLQKQTEDQSTIAFLGVLEEEQSAGLALYSEQSKVPLLLYGLDGLLTCSRHDFKDVAKYVWQFGFSSEMVAEPFVVYLSSLYQEPQSTFNLLYFASNQEDSTHSISTIQDTATFLNFKNSGSFKQDPRITEFYDAIAKLLRRKAEALIFSLPEPLLEPFLFQSEKMSMRKDFELAAFASLYDWHVGALADLSDGVSVTRGYYSSLESKQNEAFLKLWQAEMSQNEEVSAEEKQKKIVEILPREATVAGGYSAVKILVTALYLAGSNDRALITKALSKVDLQLPQGRAYADAGNHTFVQPLYAGILKDGELTEAKFLGDIAHPGLRDCRIPSYIEEE